jgi:archaemetzincin
LTDIYLWWIGADAPAAEVVARIRSMIEETFGCPVRVWTSRDRPVDTLDARRQQHSSTRILQWLARHRPPAALKVIALTDVDLFIPILTFVFGEAQLNGPAAVVSAARLLPDRSTLGQRVLAARLAKECVHELGHTFGLIHCDSPGCVMMRSVNALDVDAKTASFCESCWNRYRELKREGTTRHEQRADSDPDRGR